MQCSAGEGAEKLGLMVLFRRFHHMPIMPPLPRNCHEERILPIVCWQGLYLFYSRGCLKPIFGKEKKKTIHIVRLSKMRIVHSMLERETYICFHANPRLSHAFYHPKLLLPIFSHLFIHLKRFHSPPLSPCPDSPLRLLSPRLLAPQSALPNPLLP